MRTYGFHAGGSSIAPAVPATSGTSLASASGRSVNTRCGVTASTAAEGGADTLRTGVSGGVDAGVDAADDPGGPATEAADAGVPIAAASPPFTGVIVEPSAGHCCAIVAARTS